LVIAEQFGTLEALYPGRIDLGLGRAPGTDMLTTRALRRDPATAADDFPQDVQELQAYLQPIQPGQKLRAIPGAGSRVPLWLLGSSLYSAQLAAAMGLPFAFASHFAPLEMARALYLYRANFQPSDQLESPYAMLAINVVAADTDVEARRNFTSLQQAFTNLHRGTPGQIPPPIDDIDTYWNPAEKSSVCRSLACSVVGSPSAVESGLRDFLSAHKPDELMITAHMYDQKARLHSFEIVAEVRQRLSEKVA
jgi:luciferase family oxidoreductase group 1